MKSVKGTETEKNLLKSFAGESQARNRYTYFAGVARKEGFVQIANIFEETANQEKEHAKKFFKFLEGGMVEITSTYPAGIISTTLENLKAAAEGENEEWTVLYPEAAKVAREEGFTEIAVAFEMIAKVEAEHEAPKEWRPVLFSSVTARSTGSAVTAVTYTKARKLRRNALPASIPRHTSSQRKRITKLSKMVLRLF